ncbi:hypothetical protein B7C51_04290 [Paenibacillus larvae subsp. pulvifaciens]|uniref:Phage protein n=1 Tax=Paenibacillus larvae subsp. pulvifaciens TaxID=1477 RepID=A0A1V0UQ22_9BACL|nr:hypothetical protein [Paenibacillus larvae]ARF67196.1 hypothetical protein B7C51_04290 [Paenibacillus larvae subsp. pulvifaciens]
MSRKHIWMNPPLERLAEECGKAKGRDGRFSARLGNVVEKFDIIMKLTPTPELSDIEKMILGEVICGSALSPVTVKYMPESIMDAATGTEEERMTLRDKVITWSAAERIAAIESLGV